MSPRDERTAAEAAFDWDPADADEGPGAPFVWPRPEPVRLPPRKPRCTQPDLPRIESYDRQLRDVTADAVAALAAANQPTRLFERGGQLVRLRPQPDVGAVVEVVTLAALRGWLSRCANWFLTTRRGATQVAPPGEVVGDLLALERWPGVPELRGMVTTPVAVPPGRLLATSGYDAGSRLYVAAEAGAGVVGELLAARDRGQLERRDAPMMRWPQSGIAPRRELAGWGR